MTFFVLLISMQFADGIAACVGEDFILESEVRENMGYLANDPGAQGMFESTDQLREYVLDELISQRLIRSEAERESILVSEADIAGRVEAYIDEIKNQYPSEADFLEDIQKQGLTVDDLKRYYTRFIETRIIMQQIIQKKFSDITLSPVAVKRFYDEHKDSIATQPGRVKLASILLALRPSESALRRGFEDAVEVYKLLLAGGDFGVMAQEFSDDERTKYKGGMIGKVKRSDMVEELAAAVFSLKPGIVSQPFPSRFGYHIVEVLNKGSDWVLARQILIGVPITRNDTLRTEQLGRHLGQLIAEGADFDSLADEYSSTQERDIGEFYVNQLLPPLDTVIAALEQGELSEPLVTPIGYHLIYVREKIAGKTLTFEELRDRISEYLYNQKLQQRIDMLIDEIAARTFVKKYPIVQPEDGK